MIIKLGKCAVKILGIPDKIYDTIEDFGIQLAEIQRIRLSQDDIIKLYNNITLYRHTVRYLKDMKRQFDY